MLKCLIASLVGFMATGFLVLFMVEPFFSMRYPTLDSKTQYFSIVQVYLSFFLGIAGLFLGVFYFVNARAREERLTERRNREAKAKVLYELIRDYGDLVVELFYSKPCSQESLEILRRRINYKWDDLSNLLDDAAMSWALCPEDMSLCVALYSSIEKSDILMRSDYQEFLNGELSGLQNDFDDKIKIAKRIAFLMRSNELQNIEAYEVKGEQH